MKRALLLMTHDGSNHQELCRLLTQDPNIDLCQTNIVYKHPESFVSLFQQPHKSDNAVSVYLDVITENYRVSLKEIAKFKDVCKFVYLIIDVGKKVSNRIYGLQECAKRTGGVLVSRETDDLGYVMDYLGSKTQIKEKLFYLITRDENYAPYISMMKGYLTCK